jgi:4,5-DOPA dioxygenase extradiol
VTITAQILASINALAKIPMQNLAALTSLKPSPRMPSLFIGHGSPMNAIEDNAYRRSWQTLGAKLLADHPAPQLILCISAHWLTRGWWLTGMPNPKTIHDFGGFPAQLFAQQYPAPGAPKIAQEMAITLRQPSTQTALAIDENEWGLDHGAWSVLLPMFPAATIPVIQLSMDYSREPAEHYALGLQLAALRERGVLIVASGNIVHNLYALRFDAPANQPYPWVSEFDEWVTAHISSGNLASLTSFQQLGDIAKLAHPTYEHYLPLLYAAGAVHADDSATFFNTDFPASSISMRSVVWA